LEKCWKGKKGHSQALYSLTRSYENCEKLRIGQLLAGKRSQDLATVLAGPFSPSTPVFLTPKN
jgi:hypothetical protein